MGQKITNLLTLVRPAWVLLILILVAAGLRLWQLDMLPPGLFYDEAYNGLDVNRVLAGISRPLFFMGNNGREPLFIYLQAVSVGLLGATPLALRITSAVIGIVTVPIIYFAARIILRGEDRSTSRPLIDPRLAPWLALIAAAGLAVSYWHLSLSRVGFRAILLVPVSALAIAFFWRAWTRLRWRDFLWAGIWFGIAFYTYTSARALPLVVLAFLLTELVLNLANSRFSDGRERAVWKQRLKGLLLLGTVAGLLAAPLIWVISQDPTLFSARTGDVSIFSVSQQEMAGTPLERLLNNVVTVARNFYDQGDLNERHNLPGRPVNDPWLAVLFTLGWGGALWRIHLARNRFLLIWLAVMLTPTVLSTEAPHALRSIGALPAVAILYAVGGETIYIVWVHLRKRMTGPPPLSTSAGPDERHSAVSRAWQALYLFVLFLMLAISGRLTFNDYFYRWATSSTLGYSFESHLQLAAQETASVLAKDQSNQALLLSGSLFSQPQLRFALSQPISMDSPSVDLLSSSDSPTQTRFIFDGNFDPRRQSALIWRDGAQVKGAWMPPMVVPVSETIRQEEDSYWLSKSIVEPNHQLGWPAVFTGFLPNQTRFCSQTAQHPLLIDFANGMRLVGYDIDVESSRSTGDLLHLTLYWQKQLVADDRYALPEEPASLRDFGVAVHLMRDNSVLQRQDGPIAADFTPDRSYVGGYVVEDVRTFLASSTGSLDGAYFLIKLFELDAGQPLDTSRVIPVGDGAPATPGVELASAEDPVRITPAQIGRTGTDDQEMISYSTPDDEAVVIPLGERQQMQQSEAQTCIELAELWPFSGQVWADGSMPTEVMLPADVLLDTQQIRYPLDVTFANGLRLVGYDVEPDVLEPDQDNLRLTLYWQLDTSSNTRQAIAIQDFDVFVHLNAGGAVVQTNNAPLTYVPPAASPEESIASEEVRIFVPPDDVPSGKAHFEVGLYHYEPDIEQGTYDRIPILNEQGQAVADRVDLGAVWIDAAPLSIDVTDLAPLNVEFDNRIELLGANASPDPDDPQRLLVEIAWQALDRSTTDYMAFVHLLDETGQQIVAQHDAPPGGSDNPTSLWAPGETVRSAFPLVLPDGVEISDTTLRIGLYEPASGKQLPITAAGSSLANTSGDTYVLVAISSPAKDFHWFPIPRIGSRLVEATPTSRPAEEPEKDFHWLPIPRIPSRLVEATPTSQPTEEPLPSMVQLERYRSSVPGIRYPADVRFTNGMRLIAYDLRSDFIDPASNERKIQLSLFWQADAPNRAIPTGDQDVEWWNAGRFDIFAHLTDGAAVWQTANRPFADRQILARSGIVESVHEFVLPQDMPTGKMYFETGLYYYAGPGSSRTVSERIPFIDQQGRVAGNMVTLGGVLIGEQSQPDTERSLPIQATFQDYIELSALQVEKDSDGSQMKVIVDWRALDRPSNDYTAFVHLIDRQQTIVAQYDQPPGGVANPTHLWAPNEVVRASFPLQLPSDVELEELTLRIGLYDPVIGDRMRVLSLANDQISVPDGTYLLVPLMTAP